MDIHEKIIKLLVASGNVSEEKVEQARNLADSLVWEGEVRPTPRALDEFESCAKCHHPNKVGFVKCAWCKTTRQ
jgi:hypothetical protein